MKQPPSYIQYRQQLSCLKEQLKKCTLFDRLPIKKQLDKASRLLKRLSNKEESSNKQALDKVLGDCEHRIKQAMKKVEQRARDLPVPDFPEHLPVTKKLVEIQKQVQEHQVVVIAGETGSGKTTQLPKIALTVGRGIMGQIAHTQPRRLAARSVASRIAQELNTPLGEIVGYKVRFSDKSKEATYVKLMTDGILLAETQTDRFLNRYDTLIIDEAHERSLNIDFLLGYIKQLLPRRPDLKVIITSATIDTEHFSRFFDGAPVIEVSGRTYPVEIRYRPLEEKVLMVDAILEAVDELFRLTQKGQGGDILVFLSGEREIRETAEVLRKHHLPLNEQTEILPLYARLSPAEQNRVFAPHSGRRIVLATNVAETSLTVPGIRFVVDTGLARISRYSVRHKIQRLPIEKISQASARQRSGRCGRLSDGITIRLYDEQDHKQRPGFTEPELLRTNLAQVILQMLSLKLGDIKEFPFLEKPSVKQINDGFMLLEQLGAINESRQLTAIGRSLARLSVDPKIARVIIAGEHLNVLSEVLIIAAALSCQEPRERPVDKQQAADEKHAQFASQQSDFISYLNLWFNYEGQRKHLSHNKLRKYCQSNFLSFMRMREWRELYLQLYTQAREMGFRFNNVDPFYKQGSFDKAPDGEHKEQLNYASIHQALLTGFLGNIGFKEDKKTYLGARNIRFGIFPGSRLYKRKPKWIMAAEIVETSGVYARTVAGIEPLWLEQQAKHLLKHHYYDPFWETKAGQISAWSRISLYGLVINARKKVNYGPIEPDIAQEIFIRDALVTGEYKDNKRKTPPFVKHNQALLRDLEHLEHKSRRKDLLVDDLVIFEFYQQRIRQGSEQIYGAGLDFIYSRAAFEKWRTKMEMKEPKYLFLQKSDVLKRECDHVSDELYPQTMSSGDLTLPLEYHFLPGHALDGVTLVFPLTVINQLKDNLFDWLVPGLIREKITFICRALPKKFRKLFVPIPDTVTAFLEQSNYREGLLFERLIEFLKSKLSYTLVNELDHEIGKTSLSDFDQTIKEKLPEHLKMNFKILDKKGQELESSRDFLMLKKKWGKKALSQLGGEIEHTIERQNIMSWDFEPLPEQIELKRHGMLMTLYPALQDPEHKQKGVAIKLFDQKDKASYNHALGLLRLLTLTLNKDLMALQRQLPDIDKACLMFTPYGSCLDLKQDIVAGLLLNSIKEVIENGACGVKRIDEVRNKQVFEQLMFSVNATMSKTKTSVVHAVLKALQSNQELTKKLKANIPFNRVNTVSDIKKQQSLLIYKGFIAQTPSVWLQHLPRYFKGMMVRLEKAGNDLRRDGLNQAQITPLLAQLEKKQRALYETHNKQRLTYFSDERLIEYRWLLEELRISLFAQELKTCQPVSVKRLEKKWQNLLADVSVP